MNPVKKIREQLGISQYRLAKLLKVSGASISRYEMGLRYPDYAVMVKIARLCKKNGINYELYFGDDE